MNIKKAVLIGTLSAITITLIAIGIKTKSFNIENKTTTPIQTTQIHKSNAIRTDATNSINTLSQTKWQINTTYCEATPDGVIQRVNIKGLIVNTNIEFEYMSFGKARDPINHITQPQANSIMLYTPNIPGSNQLWTTLQPNDILYITGGNDCLTEQYINWFISNGTQLVTPDIEDGNFESLQSLMLQILTMPFSFITQAFNVTLWANTAYAFNFANFIMALIAIATILFIIKLFTSGFSVVGNYTRHSADTKLKNSQTKLNKTKIKEIESKTPKKE